MSRRRKWITALTGVLVALFVWLFVGVSVTPHHGQIIIRIGRMYTNGCSDGTSDPCP